SKPVLIDVMSMVTSTLASFASLSSTTVPSVLSKRRICLDRPMWLYEKRGKVCEESTAYVTGAAMAWPAKNVAKAAAMRVFFIESSYSVVYGCWGETTDQRGARSHHEVATTLKWIAISFATMLKSFHWPSPTPKSARWNVKRPSKTPVVPSSLN